MYPVLFSPHIIHERVAVRAPPPDRDGVLPALSIIDPDICPEHVPARVFASRATVRQSFLAGRVFAHTIRSLRCRDDKPLGWCPVEGMMGMQNL